MIGLIKFEIKFYKTASGKSPFLKWLNDLELNLRAIIKTRLDRVKLGNFGDCKNLKEGLWELRIKFGPGYRIYFAKIENKIVLLLTGGDKNSQGKNIEKAREYLIDFREHYEK